MGSRKTFIAFICIALVLGAFAVWLLRPIPSAPLPNPNGYDDLVKAGAMIKGKIDDFDTLDREELRALVETNADALRLIQVGLTRQFAATDFIGAGNLKPAVFLLLAQGRLEIMEGKPNEASRSYLDAIRFGSDVDQQGVIINRLIGIAVETFGESRLIKLLPKLGCEQFKALGGDLEQVDEAEFSWGQITRNERRFAWSQFLKNPNVVEWISDRRDSASVNKAAEKLHYLSLARLRLLCTELALRRYRCEKGRAPGTLKELVPNYTTRVPPDPFSDRSLVYRRDGTNWFLYSVGIDRVDHGGKRAPAGTKALNGGFDLFYDSPW